MPTLPSEPTDGEIAAARRRLSEIDTSALAHAVSPAGQEDLVRRAVRKLFGHGI